MSDKLTVPGTMPTLIADLICAANGSYTENYVRALCERAAESLSLESVRSEALVDPTPEQWQEFYDRVWDTDEKNPTLALSKTELQYIGRALIAALQSPARVAEEKDVHSTELRK